jgi:hypothetical protein
LPSIEKKLAEGHPRLRATAPHLHIDNVRPHTSKISIEKIEELEFIWIPRCLYSLDIAPCHLFLFGDLQHKLEAKTFRSEPEVISIVRQVFLETSIQILFTVIDEWKSRLKQCIELAGE